MKLEHHFVVAAPFDAVWGSFDRLEDIVPCVPGAALTSLDGDDFEGTVKIKLGPISMTYAGKGTFLERDRDAGRVVVEAKGKDKRGNGTAGATVTALIRPEGDETAVDVSTDLAVTGKPAQFGRGVIQDVSEKILGQFVECFSAKLQAEAAGEPAGAGDAGGSGDSAGAGDAGGSGTTGETADAGAGTAAGAASPTATPAPASAATSPAASPRPAPASRPVVQASAPAELDLLSSVMPVLARRYALPLAAAAAFLFGLLLGRCGRRH